MARISLGSVAAAAGAAAFIGGATWAVRGRSSQVFAPSVYRGAGDRQSLALTFDDGPSPHTAAILDVLAEYQVPATFFQVGANVRRNPDLARAVREAGHEIGNHSDTHPNFALRPADFIAGEFRRAQHTIAALAGVRPALLRAPYGVRWFGFREMQEELGLVGVMWTSIGCDWKLAAPAIAARILSQASNGGILCLHDGRGTQPDPDCSQTVEAVRRIVPELLGRGYRFETVSSILCPKTS